MVDFNRMIAPKIYSAEEGQFSPIAKSLDTTIRQVYPTEVQGKQLGQKLEASFFQKVLNRCYYVALTIFSLGLLPLFSRSFYEAMKLTWNHKVVFISLRGGATSAEKPLEVADPKRPLTLAAATLLQQKGEHLGYAAEAAAGALVHGNIVQAAEGVFAAVASSSSAGAVIARKRLETIPEGEEEGSPLPDPVRASRAPLEPVVVGLRQEDEAIPVLAAMRALTEAVVIAVELPLPAPAPGVAERAEACQASSQRLEELAGEMERLNRAATEAAALATRVVAAEYAQRGAEIDVLEERVRTAEPARQNESLVSLQEASDPELEVAEERLAGAREALARFEGESAGAAATDEERTRLLAATHAEVEAAAQTFAAREESLRAQFTAVAQEADRMAREARLAAIDAIMLADDRVLQEAAAVEWAAAAPAAALGGGASSEVEAALAAAAALERMVSTVSAMAEDLEAEFAAAQQRGSLLAPPPGLPSTSVRVDTAAAVAGVQGAAAAAAATSVAVEAPAAVAMPAVVAPVAVAAESAPAAAAVVAAPVVPAAVSTAPAAAAPVVPAAVSTAPAAAAPVVPAAAAAVVPVAAGGAGRAPVRADGWRSIPQELSTCANLVVRYFDRTDRVLKVFRDAKVKFSADTRELFWGLCYKTSARAITADYEMADRIDEVISTTIAQCEEDVAGRKSFIYGSYIVITRLTGAVVNLALGSSDSLEDAYRSLGLTYAQDGRERFEGFFRETPASTSIVDGYLAHVSSLRNILQGALDRYMPDLRGKEAGWSDEDLLRAGKVVFAILVALRMAKQISAMAVTNPSVTEGLDAVSKIYGFYQISIDTPRRIQDIDVVDLARSMLYGATERCIVAEALAMSNSKVSGMPGDEMLMLDLNEGVSPYWSNPLTTGERCAQRLGQVLQGVRPILDLLTRPGATGP